LKVVKWCSYGGTSYSLVQTLLLRDVSFGQNTQRHRRTDDSMMPKLEVLGLTLLLQEPQCWAVFSTLLVVTTDGRTLARSSDMTRRRRCGRTSRPCQHREALSVSPSSETGESIDSWLLS